MATSETGVEMVETSLALDRELADRLEALVAVVAADPRARAHGRVTRASVMRLALLEGAQVLEDRYGVTDGYRLDPADVEGLIG